MIRGVYALTIFLSAFLLFVVQPLFGKVILPWFGGSPGTWTTCMLSFQCLLLAGYAAAHLSSRTRLTVQLAGLIGVGALGLWTGSLVPEASARPLGDGTPVAQIIVLLASNVALPFFALSATSPLLSSWYARVTRGEPYFLFAFSNAGSMLGLLCYPFVFEPNLEVTSQASIWRLLFALYGAGVLVCGVLAIKGHRADSLATREPVLDSKAAPPRPTRRLRVRWLALACVPSVMLLAVTNHITVDLASTPFLWVVPLALYLLSFILTFGRAHRHHLRLLLPAWFVVSGALAIALFQEAHAGLSLQLGSALAVLFVCCMICHGELARLRPVAERVTQFYLWLSAGGALGGLLTGLVAPLVFVGFFELQLAIAATCVVALGASRDLDAVPTAARLHMASGRWVWLGIGVVIPLLLGGVWAQLFGIRGGTEVVERRRGFHGTLRVSRLSEATVLTHGRIRHGMEFRDPARRAEPTTYYGPPSGVGRAMTIHRAGHDRRIAVVGLGIGTLAAYGQPTDLLRFYELSSDVAELARTRFGFLDRCRSRVEVQIGDGRLALERQSPQAFDLLVIDAFTSDSVPTHLLTIEAFDIYLRHLVPDGILLVNVTNRYLEVERAVAGSALHHGLQMRLLETGSNAIRGWTRARWALIARDSGSLDAVLEGASPSASVGTPVVWRDSYSNFLTILR